MLKKRELVPEKCPKKNTIYRMGTVTTVTTVTRANIWCRVIMRDGKRQAVLNYSKFRQYSSSGVSILKFVWVWNVLRFGYFVSNNLQHKLVYSNNRNHLPDFNMGFLQCSYTLILKGGSWSYTFPIHYSTYVHKFQKNTSNPCSFDLIQTFHTLNITTWL